MSSNLFIISESPSLPVIEDDAAEPPNFSIWSDINSSVGSFSPPIEKFFPVAGVFLLFSIWSFASLNLSLIQFSLSSDVNSLFLNWVPLILSNHFPKTSKALSRLAFLSEVLSAKSVSSFKISSGKFCGKDFSALLGVLIPKVCFSPSPFRTLEFTFLMYPPPASIIFFALPPDSCDDSQAVSKLGKANRLPFPFKKVAWDVRSFPVPKSSLLLDKPN